MKKILLAISLLMPLATTSLLFAGLRSNAITNAINSKNKALAITLYADAMSLPDTSDNKKDVVKNSAELQKDYQDPEDGFGAGNNLANDAAQDIAFYRKLRAAEGSATGGKQRAALLIETVNSQRNQGLAKALNVELSAK